MNKDGISNKKIQRETDKSVVQEDRPLGAGEKDDHVQATPYLAPIEYGGYDREAVLYWDDWDWVISKFEQDRGWREGEDYDSPEDKYNGDCKAVGPCRNDFGHIGPDKEDLRFKYHYGEDGKDGDIAGIREEFRNYERPPFFLPETTKQEFYPETLTRLLTAKHQAKTMWKKRKRSALSG